MISDLFESLSGAVEGGPALALTASLLWGVLSVVLSPCHLASIPLVVAFISGQGGEVSTKRAFLLSSLFAVGILITIAILGVITAAAGRMLGDMGSIGNYIVAGVMLLIGLHLLGAIPMPWSGPGQMKTIGKGPFAALMLGLIFGIAVGPCTFAFMAPMLVVALRLGAEQPVYSAALLLAYGIGHCAVIAIAGGCTELVQRYLNWNERSKGTGILRGVCGVLIIVAGLWLIYKTA
jgi:cytochrome c-type biogenesis protein